MQGIFNPQSQTNGVAGHFNECPHVIEFFFRRPMALDVVLANNFVKVTLISFHEFFGTSQNLRQEVIPGRAPLGISGAHCQ